MDTSLGTFSSPDSLIPNVFDPQMLNRYGYVLNNPLRYTDPTGHRFSECGQFGEECGGSPVPISSPVVAMRSSTTQTTNLGTTTKSSTEQLTSTTMQTTAGPTPSGATSPQTGPITFDTTIQGEAGSGESLLLIGYPVPGVGGLGAFTIPWASSWPAATASWGASASIRSDSDDLFLDAALTLMNAVGTIGVVSGGFTGETTAVVGACLLIANAAGQAIQISDDYQQFQTGTMARDEFIWRTAWNVADAIPGVGVASGLIQLLNKHVLDWAQDYSGR